MVIVLLKGGTGNQMFQYATGRALSIKNNTSLGLDLTFLNNRVLYPKSLKFTFWDYSLDIYNINAEIVPKSKVPFFDRYYSGIFGFHWSALKRKILKPKGIEKHFHFDSTVLSLGKKVYLDGYWQSPKYFEEYEDIIRKDFTFKEKFSENIVVLANEIKNVESLCIHVRRGDYVNNAYHGTLGQEYYDKGIAYISRNVKIGKVFVFSDDIEWCKTNIKFDFPTMYVGNEYVGKKASGHLFLMSSCKYFIIPNSSFSWWGAWLSIYKNKIVVVPKKWFGDEKINTNDLIPKDWVKM